ncbi:transcriptional regulator, TetR family [Streptosporangium subroseum]|uniref:Transcriptional regulator, TetR family n=1 Tax=Streptosporangium subroseum TaxID=106412 RepID=A0A239A4S9_9ACTN|nr:TetR/AcrR family transcriptional regulator [Streptosporangium subroseum]SNR89903.1 transcriptional regulator, TetR family [Streptosporangium subroseum]
MTSTAKTSPRERLIQAATELFYLEGFATTGVQKLCQTAGVSKRSMYQLFETKDELLAEVLARSGPANFALFLDRSTDGAPRRRILHVFEQMEKLVAAAQYFGCPFVNASIELKDPAHPASEIARQGKQQLTDYFAEQAKLGGAADPATLAIQLTMLFDGLSARVMMYPGNLDGVGIRTAVVLLDANGLPSDA